jgi:hypothetical protein
MAEDGTTKTAEQECGWTAPVAMTYRSGAEWTDESGLREVTYVSVATVVDPAAAAEDEYGDEDYRTVPAGTKWDANSATSFEDLAERDFEDPPVAGISHHVEVRERSIATVDDANGNPAAPGWTTTWSSQPAAQQDSSDDVDAA